MGELKPWEIAGFCLRCSGIVSTAEVVVGGHVRVLVGNGIELVHVYDCKNFGVAS